MIRTLLPTLIICLTFNISVAQQMISTKYLNDKQQLALTNDSIFPPSNLQAEVFGSDVQLTWMPPEDGPGQWLTYADSSLLTLIGLTDGGTWRCAARWEPDQLVAFDGEYLSKIEFIPGSDSAEYQLCVWTGEFADSLAYTQQITDFTILEWNKISLDQPVVIDASKELWVGLEITQQAEDFPMGNDAGPAVQWYGDLISFEPDEWTSASVFGLDYNWMLRAFLTLGNTSSAQYVELSREPNRTLSSITPSAYKVYRDEQLLTELPVTDLQYLDSDLENGIYLYEVTALYDSIESTPATVEVQIGGPMLELQPDSVVIVAQSGDTVNQEIYLFNQGEETLQWNINDVPDWIVFESTSGQVPAGDSVGLGFNVNTYGLDAGIYTSLVEFEINNLNNPVHYLFIDLMVTGDPSIAIEPDSLNFGNALVNEPSIMQFMLMNDGDDLLNVTGIESSNEVFLVLNEEYILSPGEYVMIDVEFLPVELIDYEGTVSITSNDPEEPVSTVFLAGTGSLAPPSNLQGNISGNVVELSWLDPSGGPGNWLFYGDGSVSSAIGLTEGGVWQIAARWDAMQLTGYVGEYITKTRFYYYSGVAEYTLKIWEIDSLPNLVYSQYIGIGDTIAWNEVYLDTPYFIDGQKDLYIGYEINQESSSFPAAVDAGPAFYGYGDLVSFDGVSWNFLTDYGLDMNWSIQAFITGETGSVLLSANENGGAINNHSVLQAKKIEEPDTREQLLTNELLGYNIYRNDEQLNGDVYLDNSYYDTLVQPGTYTYTVTAVYDEGESSPAGPIVISADSIEFLLPENWQMIETDSYHRIMAPASIVFHNDNDLAPGDYIGVFYAHDNQMVLAGMVNWNGEDAEVLAYSDHGLTPNKDGFHPGDSLIWKIYRPGNDKEYLADAIYDESMIDDDGIFVENGESALKALKISTLGIDQDPAFEYLKIFPVPVDDLLNISGMPEGTVVKIFNINGKLVFEDDRAMSSRSFRLESLTAGIYTILFVNNSKISSRKLIVR